VLAAYVLHAFSDGLVGQLVGLPLLLLALAWMARRRPSPSLSAFKQKRMTCAQ